MIHDGCISICRARCTYLTSPRPLIKHPSPTEAAGVGYPHVHARLTLLLGPLRHIETPSAPGRALARAWNHPDARRHLQVYLNGVCVLSPLARYLAQVAVDQELLARLSDICPGAGRDGAIQPSRGIAPTSQGASSASSSSGKTLRSLPTRTTTAGPSSISDDVEDGAFKSQRGITASRSHAKVQSLVGRHTNPRRVLREVARADGYPSS